MQRETTGYAGGPPPVEVRELRKVYGDIVAVDVSGALRLGELGTSEGRQFLRLPNGIYVSQFSLIATAVDLWRSPIRLTR